MSKQRTNENKQQEFTRFQKMERETYREAQLEKANQSDNGGARYLVKLLDRIIDYLEYPDDSWSPRPSLCALEFFRAHQNRGIGLKVGFVLCGQEIKTEFSLEYRVSEIYLAVGEEVIRDANGPMNLADHKSSSVPPMLLHEQSDKLLDSVACEIRKIALILLRRRP